MRLKSKPWAKPLIYNHPDRIQLDSDVVIFPQDYKTYALEIGTGKGDFIVGKAIKNPTTFFFGVEKATTVIAFALKKVLDNQVVNSHLIHGDFVKASFAIPDQSFDEIYLNFSDPWPKIRHEKRRLTAPGILEKITRLLKVHGKLYMKTDNEMLFDYSLLSFEKFPYKLLDVTRNYQLNEQDIQTEYESYFRKLGQPIFRLVAERKPTNVNHV
jgi:tRNA (guanine-N7-)-methyltransferase